jgi:uncharacterized protein YjgD (DUF1641 family)
MIPTWQEEAKKDPDWASGMITNQMIQEKMQQEIDALRKKLALQKLSDIGQSIERQLTNEEIMEVANEVSNTYKNWGYYQIDFARAILKKAGEK